MRVDADIVRDQLRKLKGANEEVRPALEAVDAMERCMVALGECRRLALADHGGRIENPVGRLSEIERVAREALDG